METQQQINELQSRQLELRAIMASSDERGAPYEPLSVDVNLQMWHFFVVLTWFSIAKVKTSLLGPIDSTSLGQGISAAC